MNSVVRGEDGCHGCLMKASHWVPTGIQLIFHVVSLSISDLGISLFHLKAIDNIHTERLLCFYLFLVYLKKKSKQQILSVTQPHPPDPHPPSPDIDNQSVELSLF